MKLIRNFLRNGEFLFYRCLEIVFHQKSFFQRSESEVRWLSEFRMVLVLRTSLETFVEHRVLFKDILLIYLRNLRVWSIPSLLHQLGEFGLIWNSLKLRNLRNFFNSICGTIIGRPLICGFARGRIIAIFSGLCLSFIVERASFLNRTTIFHFHV